MDKTFELSRESIRLKEYDYASAGYYFITICACLGAILFGKIKDKETELSAIGGIVKDEWLKTEAVRQNVKLDWFVVMPNHFHGIVIIEDSRCTALRVPTEERFGQPVANSIPTIIRSFKSAVTRRARVIAGNPNLTVWQRNYYEHVIRNERTLNLIRQYILDNPVNWDLDRENMHREKRESQEEIWMV